MKKPKTKNTELIRVIHLLRKKSRENEAEIWGSMANRLSCSSSRRLAINVSRLDRNTIDGETVVVPGKVLGSGEIGHSVNVAAVDFSDGARLKILAAKGKCMSLLDLIKKNPTGKNVKVVG